MITINQSKKQKIRELKIVANRLLQNFTAKRHINFINRFEELTNRSLNKTCKMSVVIIENLAKKVINL